MLIILLEL